MLYRRHGDLYQPTTSTLPAGGEEAGYLHLERNEVDYTGGLLNEGYEKSQTGLFETEQTSSGCVHRRHLK